MIAFIYGERSAVMGKHPMIQIWVAAGAASAILVTGLLVLVIGPTLASPRVSNLGVSGALLRFAAQHDLTGQCPARVEQQLSCSAMRYLRALAAMLEDVPSLVELGWRSGVNAMRRLRQFRFLRPCRGGCVGGGFRRAGASACSP